MTHSFYVYGSYGFAVVLVAAVIGWTWLDGRLRRREPGTRSRRHPTPFDTQGRCTVTQRKTIPRLRAAPGAMCLRCCR